MNIDGVEIKTELYDLNNVEDLKSTYMLKQGFSDGSIKIRDLGESGYEIGVNKEFGKRFLSTLREDLLFLNCYASDGVLLWYVFEMNKWLVKRPTLDSYWLRCLFLCIEGMDKDGTDTTIKANLNNSIVAMSMCNNFRIFLSAYAMFGKCIAYANFIGMDTLDYCLDLDLLLSNFRNWMKLHRNAILTEIGEDDISMINSIIENIADALDL